MKRRSSARTAGRRGAGAVVGSSRALAFALAAAAAVSLLAPGQSWAQG